MVTPMLDPNDQCKKVHWISDWELSFLYLNGG